MSSRIGIPMLLILLFFQVCYSSAHTNVLDASALHALKAKWTRFPESWEGLVPCGTNWLGITCSKDRVVSISLDHLNLEGKLSEDISALSELQIFHFGKNKLSGDIPEKLFSSNMTLIHVLFNHNRFTGKIPDSLSLVKTLIVLRLDVNGLSGDIPSGLNNLTNLNELHLANNKFTGSLPILSSLTSLFRLDVSNNTLDGYVTHSIVDLFITSLDNIV
ncbi:unnamed protein product [Microthlaspi erraticum]|uniref:Leucine-rich repeat-containing N-terminal plant-type domain-containing protein n=1 Tax=Microthlaspi erraticum TaxID=1685480 RepID=A0A6D2HEU7_9BRAS|nr:unnamed protein product [Microthlaspi erraticum]